MVGGGLVVVGDLQDFSVSPRPFGFGFETKGLGLKVWGNGLTISLCNVLTQDTPGVCSPSCSP